MLQLTEDLIQDQPKDYGQEAINFLASNWIRFSGEGRVFRRAADAALRFIQDREAWFDPNLDGIQIARLMLLDPETASRSRDLLLNQLQAGLHSNNLLSSQRVKLMQTLEGLAQRSDLNESQRELFFSRLPIWRNEFLHFNSQRGIRDRVSHHAELAYLLTQDYVVASQKRRFAQAWQRAFFEASPDSKAYELMIGDALVYLSNPNLTPEIRRAFVIPLLKALNDSVGRRLEPHQRYVEDMNREYLVDRITSLPEEERIGLANVLIDEMTRRDVRAERASVLIGTLAGLITPTAELYRRMNHTVENATHPQARGIAREVLQHWQSLN